MQMKSSSSLVKDIKACIKDANRADLYANFQDLLSRPEWKELLLRRGVLPEFRAKGEELCHEVDLVVDCIRASGQALDQESERVELHLILESYEKLVKNQIEVAEAIRSHEFLRLSLGTQIYALALIVELQTYVILSEHHKLVGSTGYVDVGLLATSFMNAQGDTVTTPSQGMDYIAEAAESLLRFSLHTHLIETDGRQQDRCKPAKFRCIEDPNSQTKLAIDAVKLSNVFHLLKHYIDLVKYSGWRFNSDGKFAPPSIEKMMAISAGEYRRNAYFGHLAHVDSGMRLHFRKFLAFAETVTNPTNIDVWDGKFGRPQMLEALRYTSAANYRRDVISSRFLDEALESIEGYGTSKFCWIDVEIALNALGLLATAFQHNSIYRDPEKEKNGSIVFTCQREDLRGFLRAAIAKSDAICDDVLELLTFNHGRKRLDLWDHPLLPCGPKTCILVPSLLINAQPLPQSEDIFCHLKNTDSLGARSASFERYITQQLNESEGVSAAHGLKVDTDDGPLEFDTVAYWDGFVILLEAKCVKSPLSPVDYHRIEADIAKSVSQLTIRKSKLANAWTDLRRKARGLNLPEEAVANDKILCVSVVNIFQYTGFQFGDVVVCDDITLIRFFGDTAIPGTIEDKNSVRFVTIGHIRSEEQYSPLGLLEYLKHSPQVASIQSRTELREMVLPAPAGEIPTVYAVFNADPDGLTSILRAVESDGSEDVG